MDSKISNGKIGETKAVSFLKTLNHIILETNFRNYQGEIDIISINGEKLFFSEVKTWKTDFSPLETFTHKKISKMRNLADFFFQKNPKYYNRYFVSFCLIEVKEENVNFYTDLF